MYAAATMNAAAVAAAARHPVSEPLKRYYLYTFLVSLLSLSLSLLHCLVQSFDVLLLYNKFRRRRLKIMFMRVLNFREKRSNRVSTFELLAHFHGYLDNDAARALAYECVCVYGLARYVVVSWYTCTHTHAHTTPTGTHTHMHAHVLVLLYARVIILDFFCIVFGIFFRTDKFPTVAEKCLAPLKAGRPPANPRDPTPVSRANPARTQWAPPGGA